MQAKNITFGITLGCIFIGFGIQRFLVYSRLGEMGSLFNPKEILWTRKEKIAGVISIIFLFLAVIFFIISMYLRYN